MLPWAGLLVAFSPVCLDLAESWWRTGEERLSLIGPVLLAVGVWARAPDPAREPRRDGAVAVGAGALLELLGVAAGAWSLARAGLPIAVLGMARMKGRPPLAVAALSLFAVPLPGTLVSLASPELPTLFARAAAGAWRVVGGEVAATGQTLLAPQGHVAVYDTGLRLAAAFAGAGWLSAVLDRASLLRALPRVAGFALAGLLVQALGVAIAAGLLDAGRPAWAERWLVAGLPLCAVAGALLAVAIAARRSGPAR